MAEVSTTASWATRSTLSLRFILYFPSPGWRLAAPPCGKPSAYRANSLLNRRESKPRAKNFIGTNGEAKPHRTVLRPSRKRVSSLHLVGVQRAFETRGGPSAQTPALPP